MPKIGVNSHINPRRKSRKKSNQSKWGKQIKNEILIFPNIFFHKKCQQSLNKDPLKKSSGLNRLNVLVYFSYFVIGKTSEIYVRLSYKVNFKQTSNSEQHRSSSEKLLTSWTGEFQVINNYLIFWSTWMNVYLRIVNRDVFVLVFVQFSSILFPFFFSSWSILWSLPYIHMCSQMDLCAQEQTNDKPIWK